MWGSGSAPGVLRRARPERCQPSKSNLQRGGRGAGSGTSSKPGLGEGAARGLRGRREAEREAASVGGGARRAVSPGRCCDGPHGSCNAAAVGGLACGLR